MVRGLNFRILIVLVLMPFAGVGQALAQEQLAERFVSDFALVDVPLAKAYGDWTTAKGLKSFLTTKADVGTQPGEDYSLTLLYRTRESDDRPTNGKILAIQGQQMISVTWQIPTTFKNVGGQHTFVQLWFKAVGPNRTIVSVEQHGFGTGEDWDEAFNYHKSLWQRIFNTYESHYEPKKSKKK